MRAWQIAAVGVALTLMTGTSVAALGKSPYPQQIAAWTEADMEAQRAAAGKLVEDLAAAVAAGEKRFVIPPGQYRFGPGGPESLLIKKAKDLEIDATGVTFWLYPFQRVDGVRLEECENVAIEGLTIDYYPLPYPQGVVTEINPGAGYFEFRLDPGYPSPLDIRGASANAKIVHFTPAGDLLTSRLDWVKKVIDSGDGRFRVFPKSGWAYRIPGAVGTGTRIALADRAMRMAVNVSNSSHCELRDITVYASPHMAFTEFLGEGGHSYRNCRVIRRPGSNRLLANNADVFHSVGVEKGPTIEQCEFSFAADDLVNVHGLLGLALSQPADTQVEVISQAGTQPSVGGEIRLYDPETFTLRSKARITAVARVDAPDRKKAAESLLSSEGVAFMRPAIISLVTLDRDVAASRRDYVVEDSRVANGTIIRNNSFHDCYTRGILLKCVGGRIENNRIDNMGISSIGVALDAHFMEAPSPSDIVITGNVITRNGFCNYISATGWNYLIGAISVTNELGGGLPEAPVMSGIRVIGNTIRDSASIGILMTNVTGGEITGNTIRGFLNAPRPASSGLFGERMQLADPYFGIVIARSDNIRLDGNAVWGPAKAVKGAIAFYGNVSAGPQKPDVWKGRPLPEKASASSAAPSPSPALSVSP